MIAALTFATVVAGAPSTQAAGGAQAVPLDRFAAIAPAQPARQRALPETIAAGREAVRSAMRTSGATSASVALVMGSETVWSETFGRVDAAGTKPSPTTRFGVGSLAKMVTTMAVMQLVDAGKVSLDAPVVRYVPDFSMLSPQYRQITVRMLLDHSAGLPGTDYANAFSTEPVPGYGDRTMAGLANSHLKTTPGAVNVYCNDCFTLAGVVVERVAGMPFQDYVTENILRSLGMKHSGYQTAVPAPGTVAPIIRGGQVQPIEITNLFAAGGLVSTSDDMAQFAKVFTNDGVVAGKRIISEAAIQQMAVDETATSLRVGPPGILRYGLGWDTVRDPALNSAGVLGWTKGGDTGDYHASFVIAPDHRLGVVVEGAGTGFSGVAAGTLAQTVLLTALIETGAITRMPEQVGGMPGSDTVTAAMAKEKIRDVSGTFLGQGATLKVAKAGDRLVRLAQFVDGGWVDQPGRFELRNDGEFWDTEAPGVSIRAVKAWGRTYLVQRVIGGTGTYYIHLSRGQKTRSQGDLSPAWQARVGQKWLLANESPQSLAWTTAPPAIEIATIPGLSGYLLADGALVYSVPFNATTSDTVGTMFLQIPLNAGRDLYDLDFSTRDGDQLLSFSSSVLRPLATVPDLTGGSTTVTIGAQGLVQWYRVPSASSLTVSGQGDWKLFDGDLSMLGSGGADTSTLQVPGGALLAVFGPAGSTATVTVG
jgi:CubicO group peptidase (beta-lactamase class C family)